jgi:pimeloyl-ACP methyl ester carboxylesterase
MRTIAGGGHFLPLDRPQEVIAAITTLAHAPGATASS